MKIAISSTAPTLDAEIDPRFGRCQYFVVVDPDTMQFEGIENSSAANAGGAGIATAQTIAGKDIEAVLTGNCGPNAYQVLEGAGIKVITGVSGNIKKAAEDYKAGRFQPTTGPNTGAKSGVSNPATGGGMGGGRGMGGGGRGMGRGGGRGMGKV